MILLKIFSRKKKFANVDFVLSNSKKYMYLWKLKKFTVQNYIYFKLQCIYERCLLVFLCYIFVVPFSTVLYHKSIQYLLKHSIRCTFLCIIQMQSEVRISLHFEPINRPLGKFCLSIDLTILCPIQHANMLGSLVLYCSTVKK